MLRPFWNALVAGATIGRSWLAALARRFARDCRLEIRGGPVADHYTPEALGKNLRDLPADALTHGGGDSRPRYHGVAIGDRVWVSDDSPWVSGVVTEITGATDTDGKNLLGFIYMVKFDEPLSRPHTCVLRHHLRTAEEHATTLLLQ